MSNVKVQEVSQLWGLSHLILFPRKKEQCSLSLMTDLVLAASLQSEGLPL